MGVLLNKRELNSQYRRTGTPKFSGNTTCAAFSFYQSAVSVSTLCHCRPPMQKELTIISENGSLLFCP